MQKAVWHKRYAPDGEEVPCWLHSVQFHDSYPRACVAIEGPNGRLKLEWVPLKEVELVRRLPVSLEEGS